MSPRGGVTRGAPVTLLQAPSEEFRRWTQSSEKSEEARDRAAIVAMAGEFRVSFQFVEVAGFSEGYEPPRPYFSWGTEYVHVLEEREGFVSLQHILVIYTEDAEGKMDGPLLMKHWRQDWTYQDPRMLRFSPPRSWTPKRVVLDPGTWTQAVYQVDDSPRYEVAGRWQHLGDGAVFTTQAVDRPLPRREFSVRSDYDTLVSEFRITVSAQGWVHETESRKVNSDGPSVARRVLATEKGINRYERINSPELEKPALDYWQKTATYWHAVRAQWASLEERGEKFSLRKKVDGKKLWEHHFEMAAKIESDEVSPDMAVQHATKTVRMFIVSEMGKTPSLTEPSY